MRFRSLRPVVAALAIVVLTALALGLIVRPRFYEYISVTGGGRGELVGVAVLLGIAALTPIAALDCDGSLAPLVVSIALLTAGCGLVLKIGSREASDGLYLLPLLLGAFVLVAGSILATRSLHRRQRSDHA